MVAIPKREAAGFVTSARRQMSEDEGGGGVMDVQLAIVTERRAACQISYRPARWSPRTGYQQLSNA